MNRIALFSNIWKIKGLLRQHVYDSFPTEKQFTDGCFEQLKDMYLILGSPRSGTSVVKSLLSGHDYLLSLPGEHRYYFTLLLKNFPDINVFKECDDTSLESVECERELLEMIFYETSSFTSYDLTKQVTQKFALDWASRLIVQWPDLQLEPDKIIRCIYHACAAYNKSLFKAPEYLDLLVLKELNKMEPGINPYYYDFDTAILSEHFKHKSQHCSSPGKTIIEISPFVMLRPQKIRSSRDIRSKLLLKSSSDPYRMNTLCSLFRKYNLNIIHLTRNPLASINGLIDGWKNHCFWQHNLDNLEVPIRPLGDNSFSEHWKFDLFEGFEREPFTSIAELCKMQWLDSNRKILEFLHRRKGYRTCLQIPFESFQNEEKIGEWIPVLNEFMGLSYCSLSINKIKFVNATIAPKLFRWKAREEILMPLLKDSEIQEVSRYLGYDLLNIHLWS